MHRIHGLASLYQLFGWLVEKPLPLLRFEVGFPEDRSIHSHKILLNCPIEYGFSRHRLVFDVSVADLNVVRGHSELCAFLKHFPYNIMLQSTGSYIRELPQQLRIFLISAHYRHKKFPAVIDVCQFLSLSESTFRRRLREYGLSYRELCDKCLLDIVLDYLGRSELSIDVVAELAGFSESNTFRRAFRRWTGESPTAYRKRHFSPG